MLYFLYFFFLFWIFPQKTSQTQSFYIDEQTNATNSLFDGSQINPFNSLSQLFETNNSWEAIFLSDLHCNSTFKNYFNVTLRGGQNSLIIEEGCQISSEASSLSLIDINILFYDRNIDLIPFVWTNLSHAIFQGVNAQNYLSGEGYVKSDVIFFLEDSSLWLSNTVFFSLNISATLFEIIENNDKKKSVNILIEKTEFSNIYAFSNNLLTFTGNFASIKFQSISFKKVTQCLYMIKIANAKCNITMDFISFEKNFFEGYLLSVENSYNVTISNSISLFNNNDQGVFFNNGGGSFFLLNVFSKKILNLTVSFAFSDKSTLGLKIIDDSYYNNSFSTILIENSSFCHNMLLFKEDDEAGGALYFDTPNKATIKNVRVENNTIDKGTKSNLRVSSPCLFSFSLENNLEVFDSIFIENHSKYSSNCITFLGFWLFVSNCSFINNTSIWSQEIIDIFLSKAMGVTDIAQINPELGASIYFEGLNLHVNRSLFINTTGFKGGGIYLSSYDLDLKQTAFISETYFKGNRGNVGGGINFSVNLKFIDIIMLLCVFHSNKGKSKLKFVIIFILPLNPGGGGITAEYRFPSCYSLFIQSYAANNTAMFGGFFDVESFDSVVEIRDSFFEKNEAFSSLSGCGGGSSIMFKGDTTTQGLISNSLFLDSLDSMSTYVDSIGAIIQFFGVVSDFNSTFAVNRKAITAAAYYSCYAATTTFNNSKFFQNLAKNLGGAVGITQNCKIDFFDVLFLGCGSETLGGALAITERSQVSLVRCNFTDNVAPSGGLIHSLENYDSKITIVSGVFRNNTTQDNIFNLMVAILEISNSTFFQNYNLVFSLTQTKLVLVNVNFSDHACDNLVMGCLLNSIQFSNVEVENVRLQDFNKFKIEGNLYMEFSAGSFNKFTIENSRNEINKGSCFSIVSSNITIDQSTFVFYDFNCIYAENSSIILKNSSFDNNGSASPENLFTFHRYGTIFCVSCLDVSIENSSFLLNINSEIGSALGFQNLIESNNYTLNLFGCIFVGNNAEGQGGAVYLKNTNGNFVDNLFKENKALIGGAIYYESLCILFFSQISKKNNCLDIQRTRLFLKDNIFQNNKAESEGGAIKFNEVEPVGCSNNIFVSNDAVYGEDIAGFPLRIVMENSQKEFRCKTLGTNFCYFSLTNIASGNEIPFPMEFTIRDLYNNTYSSLNQGQVQIEIFKDWSVSQSFQSIQGIKSVNLVQGRALLSNLTFFGEPKTEVFYKITTPVISRYFSELFDSNDNLSDYNDNNVYSFIFSINFRSCLVGEIFIKQLESCNECPLGKYSLVAPSDYLNNSDPCSTCPNTANCKGGSSMELNKGFWRFSNTTDVIIDCQNFADFCLGGENSQCEIGHNGPICGDCESGFAKIGNGCVKCIDYSTYIVRVLGFIALFAYLAFFCLYIM